MAFFVALAVGLGAVEAASCRSDAAGRDERSAQHDDQQVDHIVQEVQVEEVHGGLLGLKAESGPGHAADDPVRQQVVCALEPHDCGAGGKQQSAM